MVRSGEFESPWTGWKPVIITRLDQERLTCRAEPSIKPIWWSKSTSEAFKRVPPDGGTCHKTTMPPLRA